MTIEARFDKLALEPIGIVHSPLAPLSGAGRQRRAPRGLEGRIDLFPGRGLERAVDDLARWEYIWVIFWFHLNTGWEPKVTPRHSRTGTKGVFATRSPHRPNPLGLTSLRLLAVDGLTLRVRDVDMVDGTPVLDIKPYIADRDAHPAAGRGWLDDELADSGEDPSTKE